MGDSQLDKPDVIDVVRMNASGDEVTLYLIATEPWDQGGVNTRRLHDKLKSYVSFVEDGQLEDRFPESRGLPVRIQIDTAFSLGEAEERLVQLARQHWREAGGIHLAVVVKER